MKTMQKVKAKILDSASLMTIEQHKKEIAVLKTGLDNRNRMVVFQNQVIKKLREVIEEKEEILTALEKEIDKANGNVIQREEIICKLENEREIK